MADGFEFGAVNWRRIVDEMNVSFGIFRFVPATADTSSDIVLLYANKIYRESLAGFGYDLEALGDKGYIRSGGYLDPQMIHSIEDALYKRVQVNDKLYVSSMSTWIEYFITPLEQPMCYYIVIMDIDRDQRHLLEVERMGTIDALTGAGSRNALQVERTRLADDDIPLGIVVADLNGLKQVNDSRGHDAGDAEIVRASRLLAAAFPDWDLYRFGGDEFVVIAPRIEKTAFEGACAEFAQSAESGDPSISIGFAWDESSARVDEIIHAADDAMYAAKRAYHKAHGCEPQ